MKLWCESFQNFKRLMETNKWNNNTLPNNVAIISICCTNTNNTTPDMGMIYETHLFNDSNNIINLNFDDITDYTLEGYNNVHGLTDLQAEKLFTFIDEHIGYDIYVHCSAGVSRSQGVIRFILDCYPESYTVNDTNPDNTCDFPNLHVVSLLKRNYRKKYYNIDED